MRPEGCVEASAHFVGADRGGLRHAALHFDDRLGLGVSEGHGDMAAHGNLVRLSANSMEAEAAGAEPERRLQVLGQAGRALLEILRAEPEVLIENAFEAAIDDRAHDLFDRALPRQ